MKGQMIEFDAEKHNLKTYVIEFIQTLAVCLVVGIVIYWQIAQPHKVSGLSMFPTFHNNDYIITNKIGYKFNQPKRGDIVVLTNPRDLSEAFIKRIIGLPEDRVKVQEGHVYINGEKLVESYLASTSSTPPGAFLTEGSEVFVPEGSFIVLGDNRTASSDSREWGFVPRQDIIGQVFLRYWPKESVGFIPGDVQY
ncbi:signal peptidase I [Candidatus Daviesbacteria bacterium RIFCSPHIGHO2_01_FULL_44_29]|uniref:Signal peptidase I n=1 Tax=Candidatus Daviesbacteria bacterium RIFCSPHIGHO2_02_FULL_43_12 TaxID=1797776 RepID=A0A1F5KKT5_9BACT|nr:MAG: signal peptidase I [Candidatus Daviesbacteria bacterium RIFCSPHIGHO2_01_FULL_44_29]OGE40198.1 MAG: signal peptidase I [Candidatus Daviesbacteria bacterium RIFCSPHIGHO2_12_FULL_47_45]OGE41430.1 MAG: signal peptidase I [Candidatus Daviesbacteria bacterium RIFCSPHIGHO2_02_FULL_43_12]OGE69630.1 MAG: signal peptidase I [Candidatus Daviesbacteria bacterium RIFCSPLOWO2_01_FULL_43_15]